MYPFSETMLLSSGASTSTYYQRTPSSLNSGYSTSDYGSLISSGSFPCGSSAQMNGQPLFSCSTSTNSSVGSSPIPFEQDVNILLQQTATLLVQNSEKNGNRYDSSLKSSTIVMQNSTVISTGRKSPKSDSYKTVMCQAWLESETCNFGENCRFAHGEEELRPIRQPVKHNAKYKTKLCDKYTLSGLCPYGKRCLFIHPDSTDQNAYIRPDRLAKIGQEKTVLSTSNENSSYQQTSWSCRKTIRPHPSWPLEPPAFYRERRVLHGKSEIVPISTPKIEVDKIDASHNVDLPCPFDISLDMGEHPSVLGDITNLTSGDDDSLENQFSNSMSKRICHDEKGWSIMSEDPFTLALGNDNLARHLATILGSG